MDLRIQRPRNVRKKPLRTQAESKGAESKRDREHIAEKQRAEVYGQRSQKYLCSLLSAVHSEQRAESLYGQRSQRSTNSPDPDAEGVLSVIALAIL